MFLGTGNVGQGVVVETLDFASTGCGEPAVRVRMPTLTAMAPIEGAMSSGHWAGAVRVVILAGGALGAWALAIGLVRLVLHI